MHLAATPAWFADNVAQIAIVTLLVLTVLVVRVVQKASLRLALLGLIAAVAVLTYANRGALQACARTCECQIAGRHISVPTCDPELDL